MSNYPTVRPSITLDFQKSKQLDPRISFSRSSSATYVEGGVVKYADEHQARFEKEGLLIEESRTNYVEYSYDLNNSGGYWINRFGQWTMTGSQPAPDGTNTAVQLVNNGGGNLYRQVAFQTAASPNPTSVTWSFFAKYGGSGSNEIRILCNQQSGTNEADFNVETGVLVSSSGVETPENGTYIGNGWYRFSITDINVAASTSIGMNFQTQGGTNILLWGVQIESGSSSTSYIPTSGSTSTRAADVCKITGDNFSSWFNQNEGSLAVDINVPKQDQGRQILSILEFPTTSINSFRGIGINQGSIGGSDYVNRMVWWLGGSRHTSGPVVPYEGKFAQSFEAVGTGGLAVNGSITYNATNLNKNLTLTGLFANSTFTCKRISFYPERLTNAQLEAITL